ncbi:MAG: septum formation initiator family protein [bacterium]|nr:septum formation initiator family protein [bacterium]
MVNRGRKNIFEKIFFNQKFIALTGLLAIGMISFPLVKNTLKQYRVNQEISGLKKEISGLQNKGVDLKKFVSYLESDQFVEEQARLNLNLKKAGEELTVIKSDASSGQASSSGNSIFNIPGYNQEKISAEDSNQRKWINYFFGKN